MKNYPVQILWCSNQRQKRSNRWSFPPNVRKRLEKDCAGKSVLHLFGGLSTFGVRLDIDPVTRPDVIGDAWLPPFAKESFDVVVLDPPYDHVNMQMKDALVRAAAWVARERVIWFATMWIAGGTSLKPEKAFLIRVGDGCYVRCLQYFTIRNRIPPVERFERGPASKYNRWLQQPRGLVFPEAPVP